jgi:hypothetical protein
MSLNTILATTPLTSTNYVLKATGTTIGNSLIFDNGTNVGIGNTNTSYTLDVSGSTRTSAVQPSLLINYTDATSYANLIFTESAVNKGIIQFIGSTFATTSRRNNLEIVNGANADMTFWTNNTTRMTITSAGYINIANNTAQLLPITAGNFQILGGAYYNGSNIIATSTDGQRILFSGGGFIFNTFTGATIGNSVTDTERMRITSAGNVGIGNVGDSAVRLGVTGTGTSSAAYAFIAYDITANALLALRNDGYTFMGTRANSPYNYNTTYAPRTAGLDAAGGIGYITSTRESKGNIKNIKNIDFINQLNPVSFNYRKKNENKTEFIDELYEDVYYGFIADEVEALDKNLVFYDDVEGGGKKLSGVHYNSMIAILTKAIQEQQALITSLQEQINELKNK